LFLIVYVSSKASFESSASQFFTPIEQSFQFLVPEQASQRVSQELTRPAASSVSGAFPRPFLSPEPPRPAAPNWSRSFPPPQARGTRRKKRRWGWLAAALFLIWVIIGVLYITLPASAATITLLPKSHHVQQSLSVLISTQATQSGDIQGQFISYTTPTQTQTAPATGTMHHDATTATGNVVISGIRVYSGGSADIGSSSLSSNSGVSIVVDGFTAVQGATITISAQAEKAGSGGNIRAFDINFPVVFCQPYDFLCNSPIGRGYAQNPSRFTGGANAYDQTIVKQSDIDGLTTSLTAQLTASAQAGLAQLLTQQAQPGQQMALPTPQCTPTVHADHQANDVTTQVTASGTATCYQIVYAQKDLLPGVIHAEQQQVSAMYGQGYARVGEMLTDTPLFQSSDATQGTAALSVNANSIWVYQVDDTLKAKITQQTVGQSPSDAQSALLQMYTDLQDVTVALQGFGSKIPNDTGAIHIAVTAVAGLHA
jgi:hypothetical protein